MRSRLSPFRLFTSPVYSPWRFVNANTKKIVAKFYSKPETFACISNPAISIPISRINDDYCDCPDGSDEPGTAACSGISPLSPHPLGSVPAPAGVGNINSTPSLPGFYCYNKGHQPGYVPFENVNDGVCDYEQCCDGSEEWEGINGVKCPDRCSELGKEWRIREDERQRARNSAFKRRRQLASEAQRLRREVQDRVVALKTEIEGGKKLVAKMEDELAEIEKEEQAKMVKSPKEGGPVSVMVSLVRDRIEELKQALIDVREDRNSLKKRLAQVEEMLTRLKEEHDPYLLDKGVKGVVQSWEEYSTRDKVADRGETLDKDVEELLKSDEENGINWEEWKDDDTGDTAYRKYMLDFLSGRYVLSSGCISLLRLLYNINLNLLNCLSIPLKRLSTSHGSYLARSSPYRPPAIPC